MEFESPIILDGNKCAAVIQQQLREMVTEIVQQHQQRPGLEVLLVGDSAASISYVTGKKKAAEKVGITGTVHHYLATIGLKKFLAALKQIQNRAECNGVLVQLPLPKDWSGKWSRKRSGKIGAGSIDAERQVIDTIEETKDVDGFTVANRGHLFANHAQGFKPCTPMGILALMKAYGLGERDTKGKHVCVIGRSHIVGNPICHLLSQKPAQALNLGLGDATVTQCNSRTRDLAAHCRSADIIIAAAGYPNLITAEMVKPGSILIDVGMNRLEDASKKRGYRLVGDLDYSALLPQARYITPVPGGVGPMTIAMLLFNTLQATCLQRGLPSPQLDWQRIQTQLVP